MSDGRWGRASGLAQGAVVVLEQAEMLGMLAVFRALGAVALPRRLRWADRLASVPAVPRGGGGPAAAVRFAARYSRLVPGTACLHRALAAKAWLGRRGFAARLVLGMPGRGRSEGHAWLEIDGVPLEDVDEASFAFILREEDLRAPPPRPGPR